MSERRHLEPLEMPEVPETAGSGPRWPASVIVSIAAVTVTALVGVLGTMSTFESQHYDEQKSEREFHLSCIASAATIAQMAFTLSEKFKTMPDDEKINQVNIIIASFPPDAANRFLGALTPRMGNAQAVIRAFQVAQSNSAAQVALENKLTCPSAPALISSSETQVAAAAPAPPAPDAAAPIAPGATATGEAPAPPPAPAPVSTAAPAVLNVYYQISQLADRGYARLLAQAISADSAKTTPAFPSAGIELVYATRPLEQTEIRYYRPEQADAAEALRQQLVEDARAAGLTLTARCVYIGARYPNLPAGRVEVWFQPLKQAHAG